MRGVTFSSRAAIVVEVMVKNNQYWVESERAMQLGKERKPV